ncbi:hypothetical protein DFP73DRAFT_599515 [Morchella snyderi]|nr:hypothetical protein DFP73DRAFT_599515 [Morchella snyderi]
MTSSDEHSSEQDTPQPRAVRDGASYFLPSTEIAYRGNYIINFPDDPYGSCNREQAERIHHHYSVEYQKLCQRFDDQGRVGGEEPPEVPAEELDEEDIQVATGRMVAKWNARGWDRQLRVLESFNNEEDPKKRLTAKQWDNLLEWVYQALLLENILALQEVLFNARGGELTQLNWLQRPTTESQIDASQLICLQRIFALNSLGTRGRLDQIMQRICCLDIFIAQREQVKVVAQNAPIRTRVRHNKHDRTRETRMQKKVNDELLRLYQEQTRTTTTTMTILRNWLKNSKKWNCFFDDDYLRSCPLAMICLLPTDGKLTFSHLFPEYVWNVFVANLHHLCPRLMDIAKSLENSIKSFRTSGRIQKPFQYWELMSAVDFHSVVANELNRIQSVPPHEETEVAGPSQFAIGPRGRPAPKTGIAPIRASEQLKSHRKVNVIHDPNEPAPTSSREFAVEVRRPLIAPEAVVEKNLLMDDIDVQEY